MAIVNNGELVTAYVPAGNAAAGSEYDEVYDREEVIENIVGSLKEEAALEKVAEFSELIERFDPGDVVRSL